MGSGPRANAAVTRRGLLARPWLVVLADDPVASPTPHGDIQILETLASLENLAAAVYSRLQIFVRSHLGAPTGLGSYAGRAAAVHAARAAAINSELAKAGAPRQPRADPALASLTGQVDTAASVAAAVDICVSLEQQITATQAVAAGRVTGRASAALIGSLIAVQGQSQGALIVFRTSVGTTSERAPALPSLLSDTELKAALGPSFADISGARPLDEGVSAT